MDHYLNLDQAFVRLLSCVVGENHPAKLSVKQEGHKLSVETTLEKGEDQTSKSNYLTVVEVPIVHNINVSALDNACVEVYDFTESNFVQISAEDGQVKTHKIKTENLTIQTRSGDVICEGHLQVRNHYHFADVIFGIIRCKSL